MPANTLKRPSPTAPVAMHQLIGLDYIPIIPIILESVWKPVIWGFFFHPTVVSGNIFQGHFSAGDFYSFATADGGWWREDTSNLSDKMCWRWRWFFSLICLLRIPVFFVWKIRWVWTQQKGQIFEVQIFGDLENSRFFFSTSVDDFAKLAEWTRNFSS